MDDIEAADFYLVFVLYDPLFIHISLSSAENPTRLFLRYFAAPKTQLDYFYDTSNQSITFAFVLLFWNAVPILEISDSESRQKNVAPKGPKDKGKLMAIIKHLFLHCYSLHYCFPPQLSMPNVDILK